MESLRTAESRMNGRSIEDLSDLSDIDADTLTAKWTTPREFTLAEVEAFAPHLGMTPEEFIREVLS